MGSEMRVQRNSCTSTCVCETITYHVVDLKVIVESLVLGFRGHDGKVGGQIVDLNRGGLGIAVGRVSRTDECEYGRGKQGLSRVARHWY